MESSEWSRGDHGQFLGLMARLRAVAERRGDSELATGLERCLIDASGGAADCPIAELLLTDYVETGVMPSVDEPKTWEIPVIATTPPDRQQGLDCIHRALEQKAFARRDRCYLDALHACSRAMRDSEKCPLHELWRDAT